MNHVKMISHVTALEGLLKHAGHGIVCELLYIILRGLKLKWKNDRFLHTRSLSLMIVFTPALVSAHSFLNTPLHPLCKLWWRISSVMMTSLVACYFPYICTLSAHFYHPQRTHDVIITLLLRQNDVATSFNIIITLWTPCARSGI